jgi:hypothetical protein
MKLGNLLAHLHELEHELADALCAASNRHTADHDVFHQCRTFATKATTRVERLVPFTGRYAGRAEWANAVRGESDDLLEDLRVLHLEAHEVAITWEMAAQAAKAARDAELLALATASHAEVEMQAKWFETRIKTAAPQALVTS